MNSMIAYIRLIGILLLTGLASFSLSDHIFSALHGSEHIGSLTPIFYIATIFGISFLSFFASAKTHLPSFVAAIFFGFAAQPLLHPIVAQTDLLGVIVGISAAYILFAGGLETPFRHFQQTIGKILSLSMFGFIGSAILLALAILAISHVQTEVAFVSTAVLLGAVLSSTDPAAIIPVLHRLRFRHASTPTVIIAESAVTDAVGALLTSVFVTLLAGGFVMTSVGQSYAQLLTVSTGIGLLRELLFGAIVGVFGYGLLKGLMYARRNEGGEAGADTVFFFFVPILVFFLAGFIGGSGYLAVFVTGLLISLQKSLRQSNHFFNESIDAFLKPVIFLLLGAMVDIQTLIAYAPVGILVALTLILVIRPLTVFASLGPFVLLLKRAFSFKDVLFISFVRETGAIPAVLLITIVGLGIPQADMILAIGMWVILLTLILQPMFTPAVAKWLNVGEEIDLEDVVDEVSDKPFVLLGTRGFSYLRRLPTVVDWAVKHGIYEVVVLLCLEGRYSKALEAELEESLSEAALNINRELKKQRRHGVNIRLISNKGFLQDNIKSLAAKEEDLTIICIGKRVLDYRLEEIRQLAAPLYFLD